MHFNKPAITTSYHPRLEKEKSKGACPEKTEGKRNRISKVATGTKMMPNGSKVLDFDGLRRVWEQNFLSPEAILRRKFIGNTDVLISMCSRAHHTTAPMRLSDQYSCGRSKIRISL